MRRWYPGAGVVAVALLVALVVPATASSASAWSYHRDAVTSPLYPVGTRSVVFVDASRPTAANGLYRATASRTLPTLILYPARRHTRWLAPSPARRGGPFPLVVFSHGFLGSGPFSEAFLQRIAAHGYVVAAPTFPLTSGGARGGPTEADVVNQPADVRFVINGMLRRNRRPGPLHGLIDPNEIAAAGQSLGAMTTLGVTYSRGISDPRIKAAVSISGRRIAFPGGTWTWPPVPLLLIHGNEDETVPYAGSTGVYSEAKAPKFLLTMLDAPHALFGPKYVDDVARSVNEFLDRYLRRDRRALTRLERTGRRRGVSTLESDPR
jgi:dienelactone hydrolase